MFDLSDFVEMRGSARIANEEIAVNGVPCFQWEAMVIPADAVSRNTISGNKGPTYYSGRRMRQYFSDNMRLLEDLRSRGQKVTVFPRHAAALMESALPLGWVDHYELRPSQRRTGAEDLWYVANAPLTTEGQDLRMNMRAGLVQFSSLRTLPKPHLKTEPVKLNGQVVEEAVALPIAGIDLVATQPGLPVEPIRVLEEAATIEPVEAIEAVDQTDPSGAPPPTTLSTKEQHTHMGKYKCTACQADIDAVVENALSQVTEELKEAKAKAKEQKSRREAVEGELEALKQQKQASEEASNSQVVAKIAELEAKVQALESENAQLADVKAQFAELQAREKVVDAIEEIAAEDAKKNKEMVRFIRPFVDAAIEEENVLDPTAAKELYWRVRAQHTQEFYATRNRAPSGFGHVSIPSGMGGFNARRLRSAATEEDDDDDDGDEAASRKAAKKGASPKHAGALRGVAAEEDGDEGDGDLGDVNSFQADIMGMFSRVR